MQSFLEIINVLQGGVSHCMSWQSQSSPLYSEEMFLSSVTFQRFDSDHSLSSLSLSYVFLRLQADVACLNSAFNGLGWKELWRSSSSNPLL